MGATWKRIILKGLQKKMADQGAEGLFSPFLRKQRIKAARPYLKGNVLDVGCGAGILANYISSQNYIGVDIDETTLVSAQHEFPQHKFLSKLPPASEKFVTIVALAVIEHIETPALFLKELSIRLFDSTESMIILTTPNPLIGWIHAKGSNFGIFSEHANEEHKRLLDRDDLISLAADCSLSLVKFNYFLFHANQLAVFQVKRIFTNN